MGKLAARVGGGTGVGLVRSSKRVAVVLPASPANSVSPAITGTPTVGQTLSCSQGTWTNSPTGYTYQWQRSGAGIAGATANTYLLVAADGEKNITCSVTATNAAGSSSTSANTVAVSSGPVNTVAPAITGTPTVGQSLSCSQGTWIGATPISYAYQWRGDGVDISGATASSYLLQATESGKIVTCVVTAINAVRSVTATTSGTTAVGSGPVNTVAPVVTGTPTVGQTLSCSQGTWTGTPPITYNYQWKRDGTNIAGATATSYSVVSADTGLTISCAVTAFNAIANTTVVSDPTTAVTAAPANTVAPAVTGTASVGQTLSCSQGTWTGTAPINYAYQWRGNGVDIAGATASTYLLVATDASTVISCVVTASNTVGNATAVSNNTLSVTTAPINTVAPVITGTPAIAQTLSCSQGTWTGTATITYAYQWKRNGTNISGATATTFLLSSADVGTTITCAVTATNSVGNTTAVSAATTMVTGITRAHLNQNSINGTSLTLAISPAANSLVIVTVGVRKNTAVTNAATLVDDGGNTYTGVVTQGAGLGTNGSRLAIFKCRMGANPGNLILTAASVSATSIGISAEQFNGASDDLTNVSPMVFNTGADVTCTLPNAPSAANIVLGQMCSLGAVSSTLPAGHTLIVSVAPPGQRLEMSYGNVSAAAGSWSNTTNLDGVAGLLEVKQAA